MQSGDISFIKGVSSYFFKDKKKQKCIICVNNKKQLTMNLCFVFVLCFSNN